MLVKSIRSSADFRAELLERAKNKQAFTIEEFCARNGGFSDVTYYKLRNAGLGPKEMDVNNLVLISIEAETEWRRERENPPADERKRRHEARRAKSAKAVAASIKSPNHVSKQGPRRPRGRPRKPRNK